MRIIEVISTIFPEVKVIKYGRFPDGRGFFAESFRKSDIIKEIPEIANLEILQSNVSYSLAGVIRGLHFQWKPDMGKFVRVINGAIIDLFLDIRKNSPTFGKIDGIKIESDPEKIDDLMIWIPPGFAHGLVILKNSYVEYFCTAEYSQTNEAGISPLSSDIDWSLCSQELKTEFDKLAKNAILSEKDKNGFTVEGWKNDSRAENFWLKKCE